MMNGYSVEEVDDFLDELTACYEKLYKESNENQDKIAELNGKLEHYKQIEGTLNNTLIMAQSTAEDIKNVAKQQADQIIKDAESDAKQSLASLEQQILLKKKEKWKISIAKKNGIWYNKQACIKRKHSHMARFQCAW